MIAEAERGQLTLSVGRLRRYLDVSRWTRALIESGVLGLDPLQKPLRALVDKYYFGSSGSMIGQLYLPAARTLALYKARLQTRLDKARTMLGYHPRCDFRTGVARTAPHLEWAFAGLLKDVARRGGGSQTGDMSEPRGLAHAI
jgi:hypothetical protein